MHEFRIPTKFVRREASKAVVLIAGFPVLYQISPCLLVPYFGFFVVAAILTIADINEQRLILNHSFIEYHGIGFIIETEWKNIKKIDYDWLSDSEGLYIDKSFIVAKTKYFNLKPYKGFRNTFVIPISRFAKNWRASELGQQIKQNAPHLFEKEKSA